MKNPAVVFTGPKQVELQDLDVPALKNQQVLIKTETSLVSMGTELTVLCQEEGLGTAWGKGRNMFPYRAGYSNVGIVQDVGADVDRALVGKRVQSYGSHARYVVQPVDLARPVLRDLAPEQAVFATMAEIAFNGVRRSGVGMGQSVVVYGLGLLGQLAVGFARLCGARPVIGVDVADSRLKLLPEDPAVIPVNPKREVVKEKVKDATRGRMADVVIELTGMASLVPEQIGVLRRQGTLGILSGPRGKTEIDLHDLCVVPGIRIVGLHNTTHPEHANPADPWTKSRDVELFFDLVADGDLDVSRLITHRKNYAEAVETYRMLVEDRTTAMGVLFDWTEQ